jgi:hypothetical protein
MRMSGRKSPSQGVEGEGEKIGVVEALCRSMHHVEPDRVLLVVEMACRICDLFVPSDSSACHES